MAAKSSRLQGHFNRRGPDYRFGENLGFTEIKQEFGFLTIKIGRWVSKDEQQTAANLFYDAFADLAYLLNVPSEVLGLRNSLNLAFGTGGQKNVQAHYAPGERTLALAKNAGGGALAHEWWHAFDHYIVNKLYPHSKAKFASEQWLNQKTKAKHPLNQRLEHFFSSSILSQDGKQANHYTHQAFALDKAQGRIYYSDPTELIARAFESVLESQTSLVNQFLVSGTIEKDQALIYPTSEHRVIISEACFEYFAALGDTLRQLSSYSK